MAEEKRSGAEKEPPRIPGWVYLLLLLFLAAVLLGVEAVLNWLLPVHRTG